MHTYIHTYICTQDDIDPLIHLHAQCSGLFTDDNLAWDLSHTHTYNRTAHYMHAIAEKMDRMSIISSCHQFNNISYETNIRGGEDIVPYECSYIHTYILRSLSNVYIHMSLSIVPAAVAVYFLLLFFLSKLGWDVKKAIKWLTRAHCRSILVRH
jgi:hypothetical protein